MHKKFFLSLAICLACPTTVVLAQPAGISKQRWKNSQLMNQTSHAMMELTIAVRQYGDKHKGKLPPLKNSAVMKKALLPYAFMSKNCFVSPTTGKPFKTNAKLSGRSIKSLSNTDVLFYDVKPIPGPNNPKDMVRIVGYLDHVIAISESRWQRTKKEAGIR